HAAQELGLGLHRALEHAARLRLRVDRDLHARGRGPGRQKAMAALQNSDLALNVKGLKKAFGGLPAINDVTLEVAAGGRRLIIAPDGAGKTTLFNLITGDLSADDGKVFLFEENVVKLASHRRAHRGLARTYQIITLFPRDTLEHNIALALLGLTKARWDMFRGF